MAWEAVIKVEILMPATLAGIEWMELKGTVRRGWWQLIRGLDWMGTVRRQRTGQWNKLRVILRDFDANLLDSIKMDGLEKGVLWRETRGNGREEFIVEAIG